MVSAAPTDFEVAQKAGERRGQSLILALCAGLRPRTLVDRVAVSSNETCAACFSASVVDRLGDRYAVIQAAGSETVRDPRRARRIVDALSAAAADALDRSLVQEVVVNASVLPRVCLLPMLSGARI